MIVYEFLRWQVRDVMSKAVTIPPGTTLAQAERLFERHGFDAFPVIEESERLLAETRMTLRELEDRHIDEVLELTSGNKVKAACILGIDRKTLYRRRLESDDTESTGASK